MAAMTRICGKVSKSRSGFDAHGCITATAEERDIPTFTPVRVDEAHLGAVVLGLVDHEGVVHTFTPDAGFRTLATRHAGKDGWWRLIFNDGERSEHLGFELLAVTGQTPNQTDTDIESTGHRQTPAYLTTEKPKRCMPTSPSTTTVGSPRPAPSRSATSPR